MSSYIFCLKNKHLRVFLINYNQIFLKYFILNIVLKLFFLQLQCICFRDKNQYENMTTY